MIPGEELGRAPGTCVVTNTHWRPEDLDADELDDDVLPLEDRGLPHQGPPRALGLTTRASHDQRSGRALEMRIEIAFALVYSSSVSAHISRP